MDLTPSFIEYIEKAVVENWDRDALTDYKGTTLQYHDVARKIEKLHILFPDFVIVSPKSLRQRVLLFSDVLPSALFGCKSPCSEVA